MKLFISADMEGVCGVTNWDEVTSGKPLYPNVCRQMSLEIRAAIDGAREGGVDEIVVKDSHWNANNIDPDLLDYETRLIRGWAGSPEYMVHGLDNSFDCIAFIGYHSPASMFRNPLAHTCNSETVQKLTINGKLASELVLGMYSAAYYGVPSIFISGDAGVCEHAKEYIPGIETVAVKDGGLGYTINVSPQKAVAMIKEGIKKAVTRNIQVCKIDLPKHFSVEIEFKNSQSTQKAAHYPGAHVNNCTAFYSSDDFREAARFITFVV